MTVIRRYVASDFDAVDDICLRTAETGSDATGLYLSDELMPDIFCRPYVHFEPELAFVVDDGDRAGGYILGSADTARFVARYRAEWLPRFSQKYAQEIRRERAISSSAIWVLRPSAC